MDKFLKEKIIDTTFEGLDKIIESEYKNHPNEKSYSSCRIQEGYNDYLKIVFRKGKINYFRTDFEWSTTPDEKINCEELKSKMEEYIKEVFLEEKKAIKDERECVIFAGNLLDFNLTNLSKKSPTSISRG